jgi:hypothetical protein
MAEQSSFNSLRGQEIFLFSLASTQAIEPTNFSIQYGVGAVSVGRKQQESEANKSVHFK